MPATVTSSLPLPMTKPRRAAQKAAPRKKPEKLGNAKAPGRTSALKRQDIVTLRQSAAKGRKVLYIWDRAGIDFRQWFKWEENGIYLLSREKENMKLVIVGIHPFDGANPINQGVISDEMAATSVGVTVRRVIYQDPATGIIYAYLTNLPPTVSPGIVALLYKPRWC